MNVRYRSAVHSFARRTVGTLVVALILQVPSTARSESDNALAGTVVWGNGGRLEGNLDRVAERQIFWHSPVFDGLFRLQRDYLDRIEFSPFRLAPEPTDPLRIQTVDGSLVFARLEDITDQHVVVQSQRHGTLRIRREELISVQNLDNPRLIYLGPNGTHGWTSLAGQLAKWSVNLQGYPWTDQSGATLVRELPLPSRVELEITLQWKRRPDFRIAMGVPSNEKAIKELLQLETWADELVAYSQSGAFEPIVTITEDHGNQLALRVFWDQANGELVVFSEMGRPLGSLSADLKTDRSRPGVYIENKSGDLSVTHLRVAKWDGRLPNEIPIGNTRIRSVAGDLLHGRLSGYDIKNNTIMIHRGEETTRLPLAEIDQVVFANQAHQIGTDKVTTMRFHDGTFLQGDLLRASAETAYLRTASLGQEVAADLRGVAVVRFPRTNNPSNSSPHVLQLKSGTHHGLLMGNYGSKQAALRWKPLGSDNALAMKESTSARVFLYHEGAPQRVDGSRFGERLYLANHDVLPCRVTAIDKEQVHMESPYGQNQTVETRLVKALDFAGARTGSAVDVDKKRVMLTIPRNQRQSPPTHILRAPNGDLLRGRLQSLSREGLRFISRHEAIRLATDQVASIVWLHPPGARDGSDSAGVPSNASAIQAVLQDGYRLTLLPEVWSEDRFVGQSPVLGHCSVPVPAIREIRLGNYVSHAPDNRYDDWALRPAPLPRSSDDSD